MIKILTDAQIREWDKFTLRAEGISSLELMERAARRFTEYFIVRFPTRVQVGVVCGIGNNGGDALAVARHLQEYGYPITVMIIGDPQKGSPDFQTNRSKLEAPVTIVQEIAQLPVPEFDLLIDGLFGTGLSRPLVEFHNQVIAWMNNLKVTRIAIDIPSGITCDGRPMGEVVRADFILSFQSPKLAFLLPQNEDYVGDWELTDIGLSERYLDSQETNFAIITRNDVSLLLKKRKIFDHKGRYGHALLCGGQKGMIGAMVLAVRSALRSGAGKVSALVPGIGYSILQQTAPEAICVEDRRMNHLSEVPGLESYAAIGVGPGLGQHPETLSFLRTLLESYRRPLVLDADALNLLALNPQLLELLGPSTILTPHLGEFSRLTGKATDDLDRLDKLRDFAQKFSCHVVLKGAYSAMAFPNGKVIFNPSGNPGMAKGGSGDVLTGLLTGLLAAGYAPGDAMMFGVYLHGHAGDLAAAESGMEGMTASDIIAKIPAAFKNIVLKP